MIDLGQRRIRTQRLSALVGAAPPGAAPPGAAQRSANHVIVLITAGTGTHAIDFVDYPCRPGTLLWGRPGQVHQYGCQPGLDATVVAFSPAVAADLPRLRHLLDDPFAPAHWQLAGEDEDAVVNEITQLDTDCARYADPGTGADLLGHELAVLLTRIATLLPARPESHASTLLARLHRELDRELERGVAHHPVTAYAQRLDCSVRTLTRTCLTLTGRTAKQLIDERVALQAKRLLATTALPVAQVGQRLGFPEPTNFGRFFARETGTSPGRFRADVSSGVTAAADAAPGPGPSGRRSALPGRLGPPASH